MIRNYFKVAYRNLVKNKIYTLINIFGLAIGMATCFFIFQYVHFESSYDSFNKNAARLYRVPISYSGSFSNVPMTAANSPGVAPAMKKEFPEVIDFTRIVNVSNFINTSSLSYQEGNSAPKTFYESNLFLTDASFFKLFSYPVISGDAKTCLVAPNSIVLSQSEATKYFGSTNPMGKSIALNGRSPLNVTGVFKDVPENSHIKFDALISFSTLSPDWGYDQFSWPEFWNYVLLAPGTDPKRVEAKFPAFIEKHIGTIMKSQNFSCQFYLQPVPDIHLNSNYLKEAEVNGSQKEISFLSIIGVFILLIAWINYINLSTAKSIERAKEVGLRKVVGAPKAQLFVQFMMESLIINLLALLLAAVIVLSTMPFFQQFLGKDINAGFFSVGLGSQYSFWLSLVGIFIAGSLLVGAYPAVVLSSFNPVTVLKGLNIRSNNGFSLRKLLVSFQFILSIILIAATIIIYQQLKFMREGDLGYQKNQVLVVKSPPVIDSTFESKLRFFKTSLRENSAINDASSSSDIPGNMIRYRNSVRKSSQDKTSNFTSYLLEADDHFITTYNVEMLAGRNFRNADSSSLNGTSAVNVLINEELAHSIGFKSAAEAVDQNINFLLGQSDLSCKVVGVMKNFHQRSFKEKYDPLLVYYPARTDWKYISLNVNTSNIDKQIASISTLYKNIFTGNPFQYFFLDEYFNNQYQSDQRLGNVFCLFGVLAVLIACLGLLGLCSFVIKLRVKEIGIRKVLGASVSSILVLFSKDYIKLVIAAAIISVPVIYYAAHKWLENFPFHINLSWLIFLVPPLLLLLISLLTICIQSTRAALNNPVRSLRSE